MQDVSLISATRGRRRSFGRRAAAAVVTAAVTVLALVTALPASAADEPVYETTVSVGSVTADGGLDVAVSGTGYTKLPAASTGQPSVGVMVLLRDAVAQDDAYVNANGRSLGGQLTMVSSSDMTDGAWSATISLSAETLAGLSPDGTYQVVVWPQRSMLDAATLIDTADVTFTDEQLALFGAATSGEPVDEPVTATPISAPVDTVTATEPLVQCREEAVPAVAGTSTLSWGVRASFVQYVEGAGGGEITTSNGAGRAGDRFTWGTGSGTLAADGSGTVTFPGAVNLTAHGGAMDITLAKLTLTINADKTGTLAATVSSKDMQGNDASVNGAIADLAFSSLDGNGGVATVTLNADGAQAFAGFYEAGEQLDTLTINVSGAQAAGTVERCYDADGNLVNADGTPLTAGLASTGVATAGLVALGGGALLLGVILVLWMRDRRTSFGTR